MTSRYSSSLQSSWALPVEVVSMKEIISFLLSIFAWVFPSHIIANKVSSIYALFSKLSIELMISLKASLKKRYLLILQSKVSITKLTHFDLWISLLNFLHESHILILLEFIIELVNRTLKFLMILFNESRSQSFVSLELILQLVSDHLISALWYLRHFAFFN